MANKGPVGSSRAQVIVLEREVSRLVAENRSLRLTQEVRTPDGIEPAHHAVLVDIEDHIRKLKFYADPGPKSPQYSDTSSGGRRGEFPLPLLSPDERDAARILRDFMRALHDALDESQNDLETAGAEDYQYVPATRIRCRCGKRRNNDRWPMCPWCGTPYPAGSVE